VVKQINSIVRRFTPAVHGGILSPNQDRRVASLPVQHRRESAVRLLVRDGHVGVEQSPGEGRDREVDGRLGECRLFGEDAGEVRVERPVECVAESLRRERGVEDHDVGALASEEGGGFEREPCRACTAGRADECGGFRVGHGVSSNRSPV
jgi:hypothetical protein